MLAAAKIKLDIASTGTESLFIFVLLVFPACQDFQISWERARLYNTCRQTVQPGPSTRQSLVNHNIIVHAFQQNQAIAICMTPRPNFKFTVKFIYLLEARVISSKDKVMI